MRKGFKSDLPLDHEERVTVGGGHDARRPWLVMMLMGITWRQVELVKSIHSRAVGAYLCEISRDYLPRTHHT